MRISTALGTFTIQTSGLKVLCQHSAASLLRKGSLGHSQISGLVFQPKDSGYAINLTFNPRPTAGEFLPSIPHLTINPVLPKSSSIFSLVKEGRMSEFRLMLEEGKASLRDHDEDGWSLLHVSTILELED
jgi:hypothetical protein